MNFERIWARLVYFNGGLMEFPSFDAPSGATRAATEALDRRPAPPLITRPTNAAEAARANTRIRPCLGRISASPLCRSNGHSAAGGIVREQATKCQAATRLEFCFLRPRPGWGLTAAQNESKSNLVKQSEQEGAMLTQRAGWRILRVCAIYSGLTLLVSTHLFAQVDTGAVLGTVKDQSGAVVPGAKVTLTNEGTSLSITTTSGADGSYEFTPVKIGTYTVTVEAQGFEKILQAHITVNIQQQVVADFTLRPGATTQTIEVTGAVPLLQSQTAAVGQEVGGQTINNLPLNGRNFTFLAQIVAGVNTPQADTRGNAKTGAFAANGERPAQNNYLLDGIDNNSNTIDFLNGTNFVVLPPVDAIQEFKVQTSNYSAEQGRAGGAILNATVKSGTNELHGDVWEFFRNDKLDSADFFENSPIPTRKGEFRQNQFGFTIGGPVVIPHAYDGRNKLFFFGDYEALRRRQGHVFGTNSVPTDLERSSGFTNFAELITLQSSQEAPPPDALGRSFPYGTIFDPSTTRALTVGCGGATGTDTNVTYLPF